MSNTNYTQLPKYRIRKWNCCKKHCAAGDSWDTCFHPMGEIQNVENLLLHTLYRFSLIPNEIFGISVKRVKYHISGQVPNLFLLRALEPLQPLQLSRRPCPPAQD